MPLISWSNISREERKQVEELALLNGIPLSEENLSRLYEECREYAIGNSSDEDEKKAKLAAWVNNNALKG